MKTTWQDGKLWSQAAAMQYVPGPVCRPSVTLFVDRSPDNEMMTASDCHLKCERANMAAGHDNEAGPDAPVYGLFTARVRPWQGWMPPLSIRDCACSTCQIITALLIVSASRLP